MDNTIMMSVIDFLDLDTPEARPAGPCLSAQAIRARIERNWTPPDEFCSLYGNVAPSPIIGESCWAPGAWEFRLED